MKRLILALSFLALVSAQEAAAQVVLWPSGLSLTAPQQAKLEDGRIAHNALVCERNGLDASCTQAEVNNAGKGGTIYAATVAGYQSFLINESIKPAFLDKAHTEAEAAKLVWWKLLKAKRDAICADLGKPSGCTLGN